MSAKDRQVGGSHYKDMRIQPGDYIRGNNLGWYEGNVIKYVTRHKQKNGREDVLKAIHYLELILEEYDGCSDNQAGPDECSIRKLFFYGEGGGTGGG